MSFLADHLLCIHSCPCCIKCSSLTLSQAHSSQVLEEDIRVQIADVSESDANSKHIIRVCPGNDNQIIVLLYVYDAPRSLVSY